ncbi:2-keto-4-pentenoate hydratase/2-oxohepta-3-ene-1,7-dioic acid hydratase in catechol pathway [Actinocorallia herbida]|uniref:2-keto-4-pentenoate hydratase/2-oxohepta-3-ene-1,7-dioic acid hydratase in catechol pathway n=1 Tax=Actinocorallia herbida TaxID=58109 RepID=A0A3N1D3D7_9ACTN|nr:fumarylacetoacetate hydrolase family protein [Actinocorallia herbida]ROO88019.1 2-keto-4-pentenoate hydratase/2-oxohepta-3-ene-1,7-dioic acid hydratase in catechol pathway [Actinocorallia herbida]
MKIGRFAGENGAFWAVLNLDEGTCRPLEGGFSSWAPALTGDPGSAARLAGEPQPLAGLRTLAPVEPTAKIVAVGATYAKHVAGLGLTMPERPAAFLKPYGSLLAPGAEISYPALTSALDYEAELVAVIGAASIDRSAPSRSVLGYTAGNDVSARDLQFGGSVTGMDMFSAKALDATGGVGPWIVTRDEFGDDHPDLELRLTVNGEVRQSDRTSSMAWGVGDLVEYVEARSALACGDVLFTGTSAGVGHEDGRYLEPGDVVEVTIERIGTLRNTVGPRP